MNKLISTTILFLAFITIKSESQTAALERFLSDSLMQHASISFLIKDAVTGDTLAEYDSNRSLTPASVLKLITTAAALELLGPDYRFRTTLEYSGTLLKNSGVLKGDIIIKGGGDPCLASERFTEHYGNLFNDWAAAVRSSGIKKIKGRVITDDSYFDYEPVPDGWVWEDIGNYYGAGVYGLSVFDNTSKIHFRTYEEGSAPEIIMIEPIESGTEYISNLIASGTTDRGYVFCSPYGNKGWISGTIPPNREDFILKAAITDPPLVAAKILTGKLIKKGIKVSGNPSTYRLEKQIKNQNNTIINETLSPPLNEIIEVLNHESINLYAEHLVKELGKAFRENGSASAGLEVINDFLKKNGIYNPGMVIIDGSGLSPRNLVNASGIVSLLLYMKNSNNYAHFINSLPEAGAEGTLKNVFRGPEFEGRLNAKSGSMAGIRSYAGYLKSVSGKELVSCIIVNNYSGSSGNVTRYIEEILKEAVVNN